MNIFVLDTDPVKAAQQHCNKHVVKMIIESAQILSTAHWAMWEKMKKPDIEGGRKNLQAWLRVHVPDSLQAPYSMTHANHPCTIWSQEVWGNYMWLSIHGLALCEEYTRRYGKIHKSHAVHRWLNRKIPPTFEKSLDNPVAITPFAVCMPEQYKVPGDPVQGYRNYYKGEKSRFAKWPEDRVPSWW